MVVRESRQNLPSGPRVSRGRPCSTSRYFGPISTPSLCHTLSHISGPPYKVRHTSRTPRFLVVHAYIHVCLYRGFVLVRGGFCSGSSVRGIYLEGFIHGGFCPYSLL